MSVTNTPGSKSGFLGVFSNGMVTDFSWKCEDSHDLENGWEQTNFTDDDWPNAYMRYNNSARDPEVYGIPLNVHWISLADDSATKFICRRRFYIEEKKRGSSKYQ